MSTTQPPAWAANPLRDGEYDVPVIFRVTAADQSAARETVVGIIDRDQFQNHIVPMFVPAPSSSVGTWLDDTDRTIVAAGLTALLGMWQSSREAFGDLIPPLAHADRIKELADRLAP